MRAIFKFLSVTFYSVLFALLWFCLMLFLLYKPIALFLIEQMIKIEHKSIWKL